jgi:hypothetical protein
MSDRRRVWITDHPEFFAHFMGCEKLADGTWRMTDDREDYVPGMGNPDTEMPPADPVPGLETADPTAETD